MSLYIYLHVLVYSSNASNAYAAIKIWRNIVLLTFRYRFDSFNVLDSNGYEASSLFLMLSKRRKNSRYLGLKTSHIKKIKAIVDMQNTLLTIPSLLTKCI